MPEIKLCFIPHAGGSAIGYTNFKKFLDPSVKPVPFELAGRGKRLSEECFTDVAACAEDLFEKNREVFEEGNYALFGHSLGALIAFELAKVIKKNGMPSPAQIFFSGRPAPQAEVINEISGVSSLSDEEFLNAFSVYGGIPDMIRKNEDMMKMLLPIMRADVLMADNYKTEISAPELDCDITVLFGKNDMLYSGDNMEMWQACTTGKCSSYGFTGGHFYFNDSDTKPEVCAVISDTLLK